jgi:hypothetical protein
MKRYLVKSISTEDTRYLITETGTDWSASQQTRMDDGHWHTAWSVTGLVNQASARHEINKAFGI